MALNLKNAEVERLAAEIALITGESKTEAVRRALEERRRRLAYRVDAGPGRARRFLAEDVWPLVPDSEVGRSPTGVEVDAILGYGDLGA